MKIEMCVNEGVARCIYMVRRLYIQGAKVKVTRHDVCFSCVCVSISLIMGDES